MISLTDQQLQTVLLAAGALPVEKRGTFLQRVAAHLQVRCGRFTDQDVGLAAQAALRGLVHGESAVA